ncbi:hypothetical protein C8F04DRAFT_1264875 [Mycena alexandri]|uniref:Uncharacterized protein n=1 Tax=Mycena alexandri TaxID=1745969 RepID=A0AAD6WW52_9AGAR|nr:hypothetical protein C8F04DRAFT_1264875 [Mycena alexandri]
MYGCTSGSTATGALVRRASRGGVVRCGALQARRVDGVFVRIEFAFVRAECRYLCLTGSSGSMASLPLLFSPLPVLEIGEELLLHLAANSMRVAGGDNSQERVSFVVRYPVPSLSRFHDPLLRTISYRNFLHLEVQYKIREITGVGEGYGRFINAHDGLTIPDRIILDAHPY